MVIGSVIQSIARSVGHRVGRRAASWGWTPRYTTEQIQTLVDDGYIPVASAADLYAVRTTYSSASTRVFAVGTIWETLAINTLGPLGKYIQVADIDLYAATRIGGAYYNSGAGWDAIGLQFKGIYDGGGFIVNGMFINRTANYVGMFRIVAEGGIVKNVANINVDITSTASYVGGIAGAVLSTDNKFIQCITSGIIKSTGTNYTGGIIGGRNSATSLVGIERCVSSAFIQCTGTYVGGIIGALSQGVSYIKDSLFIGHIYDNTKVVGAIAGYSEALIGGNGWPDCSNNYFNNDGSGINVSIGVMNTFPSTSGAENLENLLTKTPSSLIFTNWDKVFWRFRSNVYPILNIFGELPIFKSPPKNLISTITSEDKILLSWDASVDAIGYNIYAVISGVITKLNIIPITDLSYEYIPLLVTTFTFYVTAIHTERTFAIETGPGNITEVAYSLPNLVQMVGDEVWISDGRDKDNAALKTIISPAIAKEYGQVAIEIPMTASNITEGVANGDWFGDGTVISRTFDDDYRTITQVVTVESRRIIIANNVTYKQDIKIEYEGFQFTGNVLFSSIKNAFGTGSGQNIINSTGIFFHNGNYTSHKVYAGINEDFKWKQYGLGSQENTKLYLMDGRDYVPSRIMLQPNGYNASMLFSNHPDGDTMKTRRTVHYGASNISDVIYGTKGITARGIKVDWGVFTNLALQWLADPEYKSFLQLLKSSGSEIVPHSIHVGEDHRSDAVTALPELKNNFAPSNWIDHSLSAGAVTCGIASKGWDVTDAANYILDLLEENGFDKAWAYQDFTTDMVQRTLWGFEHELVYNNDHLKLPVSGNHITLWKACSYPFYNNWLNVDELIANNGVVNSHDYLGAATTRESATDEDIMKYTYYPVGDEYRITSGFDLALQKIVQKKNSGELWNPTTTEWVEYCKKLKLIQMDITDANTLTITNNGSALNGFSILICKKDIAPKIGGVDMNHKEVKNGTICWADLPVGESIIEY